MAAFGDDFDDEDFEELLAGELDAGDVIAFHVSQSVPEKAEPEGVNIDGQQQRGRYGQPFGVGAQVGGEDVSDYPDLGDDDDDVVIDEARSTLTSVRPTITPAGHQQQRQNPAFRQPRPALRPQPPLWNHIASDLSQALPHSTLAHRPSTQPSLPEWTKDSAGPAGSAAHHGDSSVAIRVEHDVETLQAQLQELLRNQQKLQKDLQDASRQAATKTGEITIARSNYEKVLQDKERRLLELQHQLVVDSERHKVELEQATREKEKLATDFQFLDYDKVIARARPSKQSTKATRANTASKATKLGVTTPKKARQMLLGDGFEQEERSPIKAASRSQPPTPQAGEKRKRAPESPVKRLELSQTGLEIAVPEVEDQEMVGDRNTVERINQGPLVLTPQSADESFEILQSFVDHRTELGYKRTIETLADYAFPLDPQKSLSSLIYDQVATVHGNDAAGDLAQFLCGFITTLWTRCLAEKYFEPTKYLMSLAYSLILDHPLIILYAVNSVLPLAQKTADTNMIPRFKRFRQKPVADKADDKTESQHVKTDECLEVLLLITTSHALSAEDRIKVWRQMRFDFISIVLRPSQALSDVSLMTRILGTSIRKDGFGPIVDASRHPEGQQQSFNQTRCEEHLVDRLTAMLLEEIKPLKGHENYSDGEIAEMRLDILDLTEQLCEERYSAEVFARHPQALGRLVRCMSDEFGKLYDHQPGFELKVEMINRATRLVYHLIKAYPEFVNIQEKLEAVPGGPQKYLIILTRLAFADGSFYSEGIEDDVIECAHQLLEEHVSPEEGEAIMAPFQTGNARVSRLSDG